MPHRNPNLVETFWDEAMFGMAIVNTEGVIIDANPKLCELLGYPYSALVGKTFHDITHPDDYQMDANEFNRLKAGEIDRYGMFKRYITKSGEVIGLKLKVVAVRADGNLELILGQVSDAHKIIPLDAAQIKKVTQASLGQFVFEHWKEVGIFILIIMLGTKFPDILKAFM